MPSFPHVNTTSFNFKHQAYLREWCYNGDWDMWSNYGQLYHSEDIS